MSKLDEKRVEWMYEHFQGISRLSDRLLVLFGVLVVSAMAVWLSDDAKIELPFIKVSAGRDALLGCLIASGAFTLVAFFGNFDMGEAAVTALAEECECGYEDLWFLDTHPTLIDFAKFRRHGTRERKLPARFAAALLYPIALLGALSYLTFLWGYEVFMRHMGIVEVLAYFLGVPALWVAWDRGGEYFSRRWKTFWRTERERIS
jgi:hypothetical protein